MAEPLASLSQGETFVALTVVLWFGIVLWSAFRPESRHARYSAIAATLVAIAVVLTQWSPPANDPGVTGPVAIGPSCALVHIEMTETDVLASLGEPERKISDEDVRGPGAEHWIYPASGCRVHFLDGVVRAID